MDLNKLIELGSQERFRLTSERGGEARYDRAFRELFLAVRKRLQDSLGADFQIKTPRDLFICCGALDDLPLPPDSAKIPEIGELFLQSRRLVSNTVLSAVFDERRRNLQMGDIDISQKLWLEKEISNLVPELLTILKGQKPAKFGVRWIQMEGNGLYDRFSKLVRDPVTNVPNWKLLKDLLPPPWDERFQVEPQATADQRTVEQLRQYQSIAEALGPEALAEFLLALNPEDGGDFSRVLKIISQYLGRCQTKTLGLEDLPKLPEALLRLADVRKVVFVLMRNYIYRKLIEQGDDAYVGQHAARLKSLEAVAKKILDVAKPVHKELWDELMAYFKAVFEIAVPDRMVDKVAGKDGRPHPFPSLRQRIAMYEMQRDPEKGKNGRKLVSFFMGQGKTGTAFLAKENVKAKKMLYITPKPNLAKLVSERVKKYYKKGEEPTVGVITADTPKDKIAEALEKEVVVLSFTMFSSKVGDTSIVDMVAKQSFDFVTVDEVHNARQEEQRDTEAIYKLISEIPGLYESGYALLLSGDPIPNGPDDIVPQLRIYDKEAYAQVKSLRGAIRKHDPLVVRNALLDFLLLLDEPEDWQTNLEYCDVHLSEDEVRIYKGILENEDLTHSEKLQKLSLMLINPSLFSPTIEKSTYTEEVARIIAEDLVNYDVVVVGENNFQQGVLRKHGEQPDALSFVEIVKANLSSGVEICIYDGNTSNEERDRIIETSKIPGKKMVIFAMTSTMREGIDLSHIHRAIMLQPNYNLPDTAQFAKRFDREGNEDFKLRIVRPVDTVFEGIYRHGQQKAVLCDRLKFGGTLTDADLAFLEGDDLNDDIQIEDAQVVFGTHVADGLLTDRQKLMRIFDYLHGKGGDSYRKFIQLYGDKFAELYMKDWEGTFSGNNSRFVAGLINKLSEEGLLNGNRIADVASGPLVLMNVFGPQSRFVVESMDLNPFMLDRGLRLYEERYPSAGRPITRVVPMDETGIIDGSFDCVTLNNALHYTNLNVQRRSASRDERARSLMEQNRLLKLGGIFILTFSPYLSSKEEFESFSKELSNFGFEILPEYTGEAVSTDTEDHTFKNLTIVCRKVGNPVIDDINLNNLKMTRVKHASTGRKVASEIGDVKTTIHTEFLIADKNVAFAGEKEAKMQKAVLEKDDKMDDARRVLLEIYLTHGNTLEKLDANDKTLLKEKGITLLKYRSGTTNHWTFTLKEWPDETHPVFPS